MFNEHIFTNVTPALYIHTKRSSQENFQNVFGFMYREDEMSNQNRHNFDSSLQAFQVEGFKKNKKHL